MSKKCEVCEGTQVKVEKDGTAIPCPALSVTALGRLACKLPDGSFDSKKTSREISNAKMQKDKAYEERNKVVSGLARAVIALGGKAGRKKTKIEGWNPEWDWCVYIDLPMGLSYPEIGGVPVHVVRYRKVQPLKGSEMGKFTISECDKDLLNFDWFKSENTNGVYWKRQPSLPEPTGYLHRVIAKRIWGEFPDGFEVDHIDRNPSNCCRDNLRLATSSANKLNQKRIEHAGVYPTPSGKWMAVIGVGSWMNLGTFQTEQEARSAYLSAHKEFVLEAHRKGEYIYPPLTVSWHFHESHLPLFEWLPLYDGAWDGHDTLEKYRRLEEWRPPGWGL